jgi:hypothetical protein
MDKYNLKTELLGRYEKGYIERYGKSLSDFKLIVGENLRVLRNFMFKDYSLLSETAQKEYMAIAMGINRETLIRIEDCKYGIESKVKSINADTLIKISSFANIPMSLFFQKNGVSGYLQEPVVTIVQPKEPEKEKQNNVAPKVVVTKARTVKDRIKQIIFYMGDEGATILLPNKKTIVRPVNTSVDLYINDHHHFFVDILRSKETNEVFFMHSHTYSNIIHPTITREILKLPSELTYYRNVGTGLCLTLFKEQIVKIKYYDYPKVLEDYDINS